MQHEPEEIKLFFVRIIKVIFCLLILVFFAWVGFLLYLGWIPRPLPISRVKNDQRNLATGLESYFNDWGVYPAPGPPLQSFTSGSSAALIPPGLAAPPVSLSTPVPYVSHARPQDPFNDFLPIAYLSASERLGYLLISAGPDGDFDFNPARQLAPEGYVVFDPSPVLYDASNGTISDGDIIRTRRGIALPPDFLEAWFW